VLNDSSGALEPPRPRAGPVLTPTTSSCADPPNADDLWWGAPKGRRARASGAGEAALLLLRELLVGQNALIMQFTQLLELREHRL
jgi:hypothetical protein